MGRLGLGLRLRLRFKELGEEDCNLGLVEDEWEGDEGGGGVVVEV